ncbi:MAG: UDP-N-acetylmuramoyl-L-alanine--D-glutamate ligase, partial [Patescibacteria group bacterium]|nr:UDP-N-acetylmuramoyl-L-alanine--D-glutamate ligase [Patescibacteria group bacterium]
MDKSLKNKKVGILGFGMEGKDLANYLHKQGALITVFDQKTKDELNFQGIDTHEIEFVCGSNYLSGINSDFDIIFRSPGVYRYKEELIKAERNGVAISSAIKLFFEKCPSRIIGVTGTKGKGTTSTLIYNICKEQGLDVYLAGNIGKPYLELLPSLTRESIVVMEISSFQLIDLHKSPHVAVVLNITSDHLDWHLNQEEYVSAKKNIVLHQNDTDYAVINFDYETPRSFEKLTRGKVFYFSKKKKVNGCYVTGNKIRICMNGGNQIVGDVGDLQLRGRHNWENVTAAVCASFCIGCNIDSIKKSVFDFKGLEHRLEFVSKINGVSYYNDSFSTNPQPTMAAVDSFSEPVILILGGSDKGLSYSQMASHIAKVKNVKAIILIGQIADRIEFELRKANFKGLIFNLGMTSMQKVVEKAREVSASGDVVLLSPASASF